MIEMSPCPLETEVWNLQELSMGFQSPRNSHKQSCRTSRYHLSGVMLVSGKAEK